MMIHMRMPKNSVIWIEMGREMKRKEIEDKVQSLFRQGGIASSS